jgi:hypothetical protein
LKILSADLDKFARSLRIKEYFSAKERDCPVDESSDSEDDNEIPLPRFKKLEAQVSLYRSPDINKSS